jgi:hypothetical protein
MKPVFLDTVGLLAVVVSDEWRVKAAGPRGVRRRRVSFERSPRSGRKTEWLPSKGARMKLCARKRKRTEQQENEENEGSPFIA